MREEDEADHTEPPLHSPAPPYPESDTAPASINHSLTLAGAALSLPPASAPQTWWKLFNLNTTPEPSRTTWWGDS